MNQTSLLELTMPFANERSYYENNHNGKQKLGCILYINGKHPWVLHNWLQPIQY